MSTIALDASCKNINQNVISRLSADSAKADNSKKQDKPDAFKMANDCAIIGTVASTVTQAPAQLALIPEVLQAVRVPGLFVKFAPRATTAVVNSIGSMAGYLEGSKIVQGATSASKFVPLAKANAVLGKVAPVLGVVTSAYTIKKNIDILNKPQTTASLKLKSKVQIGLNAVSGVTGFCGPKGMAVSAVAGVISMGVDFIWKK